MNKEKVFAVTDKVCKGMKKAELDNLEKVMLQIKDYQQKKITYEKMDEILLFTPGKVKEAAYRIQETMYPDHAIRGHFEVTIPYTEEQEQEDFDSVYDGLVKQAKERNK